MKEDILLFVLNTKLPLSDIWLLSYKQNSFVFFLKKNEILVFSENTQNCFTNISATKYRSEAILYSNWMAGYSLSPFEKTPNFGCMVHTLDYTQNLKLEFSSTMFLDTQLHTFFRTGLSKKTCFPIGDLKMLPSFGTDHYVYKFSYYRQHQFQIFVFFTTP